MTVSFSRVDMPPHAVRLAASNAQTNHLVDLFIVDLHFSIACPCVDLELDNPRQTSQSTVWNRELETEIAKNLKQL